MEGFNRKAVSLAVIAATCGPVSAWAMDVAAADESTGGIQDIVVTAEKRAATVQDTPIAVSAFDQSALDRKGIQDVTALQAQVPSLKFTLPQGVVQISLRGAGNDAVTTGADNGVGFHYDGVYLGNPAGSLADMWDVERVEVLRGPQGTLYGRNTTGGAINIIPAKPDDQFMVKGDVSYASHDWLRVRGAVNIPLSEGIASRFAMTRSVHDGFQKNINPAGRDGDDLDQWTFRGALAFDLGGDAKFTLSGTYSRNKDSSASSPVRAGGYPQGGPAGLISAIYATVPPRSSDPRITNKNFADATYIRFAGAAGLLEWDLGPATLRSTTSYYETKRSTQSDWDDSPLDFVWVDTGDKGNQFSQELTLISDSGGSLDYIFGAYLYNFKNDRKVILDIGEIDGARPGPFLGTDIFFDFADRQKIRSRALYSQLTYHFSDSLRLTGGFRYSWDRKSFAARAHPPAIGAVIPPPNFYLSYGTARKWAEPTGKIGLDYDLTRDNMLYATYSHGYKAGAINSEDPVNTSTNKELVDSWEVGAKNYFLDRIVQFNIAAFYTKYKDVQIKTFPVVSPILINVPGGTAKGLEVDFALEPSRHFRIDGSVGYIDSSYKSFMSGNPAVPTGPNSLRQDNIGGNPLINTPKYTFALGGEVMVDALGGELRLRGDFSYRSRMNFDIFGNADMQQKGYTKTDLRLTWTDASERYNVQVFAQNLENSDVKVTMLRPGGIAGSDAPLAWFAAPRIIGASFGVNF